MDVRKVQGNQLKSSISYSGNAPITCCKILANAAQSPGLTEVIRAHHDPGATRQSRRAPLQNNSFFLDTRLGQETCS